MKSIKSLCIAGLVAAGLAAFPAAAAASPGLLIAGDYPATLSGVASGEQGQLSTVFATTKCTSPTLSGSLDKASESVSTSASYSGCGDMQMNGCRYILHPPVSGTAGSIDIGGAECSGITVTQGAMFPIRIPPQSGLATTVENEGSGSTATMNVTLHATGLEYEYTGNYPPYQGLRSDGTYTTAWTLSGEAGGSSTGVSAIPYPGLSVIGEGAEQMFHSDYYPVTVGGNQVAGEVEGKTYAKNEIRTVSGNFKCNGASFGLPAGLFPGGLGEDVELLMLTPTYSGCTLAGLGATATPESGCTFEFNASGVYAGNLGLCRIEIKPSGSACVITIDPQSRAGLSLANQGSGSNASVTATANVTGVSYEVAEGKKCPNKPASGSYSDGKYLGAVSLGITAVD